MLFHDCYVVGQMLNSEPTCIIIGVLLDIIKKGSVESHFHDEPKGDP